MFFLVRLAGVSGFARCIFNTRKAPARCNIITLLNMKRYFFLYPAEDRWQFLRPLVWRRRGSDPSRRPPRTCRRRREGRTGCRSTPAERQQQTRIKRWKFLKGDCSRVVLREKMNENKKSLLRPPGLGKLKKSLPLWTWIQPPYELRWQNLCPSFESRSVSPFLIRNWDLHAPTVFSWLKHWIFSERFFAVPSFKCWYHRLQLPSGEGIAADWTKLFQNQILIKTLTNNIFYQTFIDSEEVRRRLEATEPIKTEIWWIQSKPQKQLWLKTEQKYTKTWFNQRFESIVIVMGCCQISSNNQMTTVWRLQWMNCQIISSSF